MAASRLDADTRAKIFDEETPPILPESAMNEISPTMIVVKQRPAADREVPPNTPVNITLAVKETLPMAFLAKHPLTAKRWHTVGALYRVLADQTTLRAIVEVVPTHGELATMPQVVAGTNNKSAWDSWLKQQFPSDGDAIPAIYDDIALVYNL